MYVPKSVSCAVGDLDTIIFVQLLALAGLSQVDSLFIPCVDDGIHFSILVPSWL